MRQASRPSSFARTYTARSVLARYHAITVGELPENMLGMLQLFAFGEDNIDHLA